MVDRASLKTDGSISPEIFRSMMRAAGNAIAKEKDRLSELDGVIGDGDHGVTMDIGWQAILKTLDAASDEDTISQTCTKSAKALLDGGWGLPPGRFMPGPSMLLPRLFLIASISMLPPWLYGLKECLRVFLPEAGASAGDKTMIDAWVPAVEAAKKAAEGTSDAPGGACCCGGWGQTGG